MYLFEEIGLFSLLFLSKKYFRILFILIFNMVNLKRYNLYKQKFFGVLSNYESIKGSETNKFKNCWSGKGELQVFGQGSSTQEMEMLASLKP